MFVTIAGKHLVDDLDLLTRSGLPKVSFVGNPLQPFGSPEDGIYHQYVNNGILVADVRQLSKKTI